MSIQDERVIFPHVVPPAPETEDQILEWARAICFSLTELNRQVVDKYNNHIKGTHSHPAAWPKMKIRRPRFYAAASGGTTITVPGSASLPSWFVIDGEPFEIYTNLTCDLSGSGAGGLDTGAIAANTPYYLYGVRNSGSVSIIASASDPGTGPTGYTVWTYLGAVATDSGGATFNSFNSVGGVCIFDKKIEGYSHTGDTTSTPQVYSGMPVTSRIVYGTAEIDGPTAGGFGKASGVLNGDGVYQQLGTANADIWNSGWLPIFTSQTIYLQTNVAANTVAFNMSGWQEDPTEYP